MSFNRTKYDTCNYKQDLQENVNTLSYVLAPIRYENENKCRHQLGFIGGTNVSHIKGNIVDLESELRGQTRLISKCGTNYYIQLRGGQTINGRNFFYLAKQIKERFDLEVTALQLKTIFHKDKP